jgi:hypothetical protein
VAKKRTRNDYLTRSEFRDFVERADRRFLSVLEEPKTQREELKSLGRGLEAQGEELRAQRHWTEIVVGGFQRRAGRNLEEMVAGCLRVALDMTGIKKEGLKLRRKLLDEKGEIGPPGREYEIDIYASNGKSFLFEIKRYAEPEDVQRFADKADLAVKKWGLEDPGRVFVTLEKSGEMQETCLRFGITLA